jgi:predicted TPR repeat methyltransferase
MKARSTNQPPSLCTPPRQFFMNLYDLQFWYRSAKADSRFAKLCEEHGTERAFDLLYAETNDPWGYLTPQYRYQRLKYDKLMGMLPQRPYASALDVGCGLGVFTRMLAPYVESALGVDISAAAIRQAEQLSQSTPHLRYVQGGIFDLPTLCSQQFDLIAVLDILYYLSPLSEEDLERIVTMLTDLLTPGGLLLLGNHFFFDIDPQSKIVRQIHVAFRQSKALQFQSEQRHPFFLASLFEKC